MNISYYGESIKGNHSPENEDYYLLPEYNNRFKIEPDIKTKGSLFLLCDGMGGAKAGEVASNLCCHWFFKEFYEAETITDNRTWINEEIDSLNNRLFQLSCQYPEYSGMGTTLLSLLVKNNEAVYNNVGDSRLYLLRGNKLVQLTEDDSQVWELYRAGKISKEEILTNRNKNIITQAMALRSTVAVHEYSTLTLEVGDKLLLMSDGISDVLLDEKILSILQQELPLEGIVKSMIKSAIDNKSQDDVTVILVKVEE